MNVLRSLRELVRLPSEAKLVEPEFDAAFYRARYPDIAGSGIDPLRHFLRHGWREGRDPNARFSTRVYLDLYRDVSDSGINPFVHYLKTGRSEGRICRPLSDRLEENALEHAMRVIRPYFDAHFYRKAYALSDAPPEQLLEHFVRQGWQEGRDPNARFSVSMYLARHRDIREAGINPYLHYLESGRAEGRGCWPSSAKPQAGIRLDRDATGDGMKMGVVVMVRNEADILRAFLSHVLALFDVIVFIDHGSTDGTLEVLQQAEKEIDGFILYQLREPGYVQSLATNFAINNTAELRDTDWIFALDADEFLPFDSRESFHAVMDGLRAFPVIGMHWKNVAPVEYADAEVTFEQDYLVPAEESTYRKVAFQSALLKERPAHLAQGNHALLRSESAPEMVPHDAFFLYHLPIRSKAQVALKLTQGVLSHAALGEKRDRQQGSHWDRIRAGLENRNLDDGLLNGLVAAYGEHGEDLPAFTQEELSAMGFERQRLALASAPLELEWPVPLDFATAMVRSTEAAGRIGQAPGGIPTRLHCHAGRVLSTVEDERGIRFTALEAAPETGAAKPGLGPLFDFLRPSYWRIESLVTTAWGGHIPILFSLANLLRPRRFVELGTHYGASFFAYCQAARKIGFDTDAVAVDCWAGDDHTRAYGEEVFAQFSHYLRRFDSVGSYIRDYFDNAVSQFADGSIDLLHIDGLHTYDAVRHDFETWLPKMSDRGVVMFHDVKGHDQEFEVWRFWREIRDDHPSLEFGHSHGLGIIVTGSDENHPLRQLIRMVEDQPGLREFLQWHYQRISQLLVENCAQSEEIGIKTEQLVDLAETREKLAVLEQETRLLKRIRLLGLSDQEGSSEPPPSERD